MQSQIVLTCTSLIDFNEAFITYNQLQFLGRPSILTHKADVYAYGLVVLVHRNIQVTTIMIGYTQLCQGFEC